MKIGVIRHAKVLHHDKWFSTGSVFNEQRKAYDIAEIVKVNSAIMTNDFNSCYVSSRKRAIETAQMIYQHPFFITDELVETDNRAFFFMKQKVPAILHALTGRIAWFINYHKMPEARKQSNERARRFIAKLLAETNENVLLVTHGFFMQSLRRELKKQGFKGYIPLTPKHMHLYIFERMNH